ncbi:MAG: hypothetical protein HOP29_17225 [Phycisphaerales bacterium]|nr:hypothetical protein [Phycisphaerales bacterium]
MSYADLLQIAIHEAGHCVVGIALEHKVEVVTVSAGGGRMLFERPIVEPTHNVAISVAGLLAEHRDEHGPFKTFMPRRNELESDFGFIQEALSAAPRQCDWSEHPTYKRGVRLADDLLRSNWHAVGTVARALSRRGTLTGAEINKLLGKHEAA